MVRGPFNWNVARSEVIDEQKQTEETGITLPQKQLGDSKKLSERSIIIMPA
jgi:hypothetical protein